jgi:TolB-like protein/DNA-binding winged helix-turn-helix (wHTH) protein
VQTTHLISPTYCFGAFELDSRTGELRKKGMKIRLQGQPVDILVMLLQHPRETVTRQDLQKKLWPDDTFVDFDQSLNNAMKRLRAALGDNAESPHFIETLPRRGYRFIGSVNANGSSQPPAPPAELVPAANKAAKFETNGIKHIFARQSARSGKPILMITATAIVILAVLGYNAHRWLSRPSNPAIDSIAVLPFANSDGDSNNDYLSDGITESLIDNLAHVPQLKVKSRNSVFRYKGKDVEGEKVGKDLGVSALVIGRVAPHGDRIEVSAELTDVRDNTVIWGQHYSSKITDIISLQQQISGDLARKLRSRLSASEKQQVANQGTQNPEAYEFYLKGRYYTTRLTIPDIKEGINDFNQAIAKDPGYALAYSGLADAYGILPGLGGAPSEIYPKANAAARKALELDTTLARPHAILGSVEMFYDWDISGGEAEFKKALELDPNDANVHAWYAHGIVQIGGREQEAIAEAQRADKLDPLDPSLGTMVGLMYMFSRHYDDAVIACKRVADDNPTFALPHLCLAPTYWWGKRLYPQAIEEWQTYGQLSGDPDESEFASALARGYRSNGWKGALTNGIEARKAQRKKGYSSAFAIAAMYADMGQKDQAFTWLNTAYQERDWRLEGLNTEISLDPLRSDPRFTNLARKMGLPHEQTFPSSHAQ